MTQSEKLFTFPSEVNEVSARLVAGGVALVALGILVSEQWWLLVPLAYGFIARFLTGPTLSPLGQLVTRVITPRLPMDPRPVPGPPKRFAQGIGAILSVVALVAHFGFGANGLTVVFVGLILVAASLEAVAGFCLGCLLFTRLMRIGLIPGSVCERCSNISGDAGAFGPRVAETLIPSSRH